MHYSRCIISGIFAVTTLVLVVGELITPTRAVTPTAEGNSDTILSTPTTSPTSSSTNNCSQRILVPTRLPRIEGTPPPKSMPAELEWAYTRCGTIPTASYYVDDTRGGKGMHIRYSHQDVQDLTKSATALATHPNPAQFGKRTGWLAAALRRHTDCIANRAVAVIGSIEPTIETLALAFGAARVLTVEYNNVTYEHPQLHSATPAVFEAGLGSGDGPDAAPSTIVSLSSYDHDGLGRYGDPIAPDGDLLSMSTLRAHLLRARDVANASLQGSDTDGEKNSSSVCPNGPLLFLTIPIGPDIVVWNLLRRYGRIHLPLLLSGWEIIDTEGWEKNRIDASASFTKSWEPVLVLRPVQKNETRSSSESESNVDETDFIHASVRKLLQKRKKSKKSVSSHTEL